MLGELMALGCALAWGFSVILFKQAEHVPPQGMNLFKNALASVLLGVTLVVMGQGVDTGRSAGDWARVIVSGTLGLAVADSLFLESLRRIGPGLLAIVDCIYAPLVVLFSVLLLGEHLGLAFLLGAVLVVGGILIATSPDASASVLAAGERRARMVGALIGALSILFMAFAIVLVKPVIERSGLIEVTFVRLVAGTVTLVPWLLVKRDWVSLGVIRPQRVWRRLAPAAFLGTYVSMILWVGGMKYTGASVAAVMNQMSVVFTLILARLILGEHLSRRRMVGGGASLAGAMIILLWA
jgi:drug/metabolite transporter (DMT)-like permease